MRQGDGAARSMSVRRPIPTAAPDEMSRQLRPVFDASSWEAASGIHGLPPNGNTASRAAAFQALLRQAHGPDTLAPSVEQQAKRDDDMPHEHGMGEHSLGKRRLGE